MIIVLYPEHLTYRRYADMLLLYSNILYVTWFNNTKPNFRYMGKLIIPSNITLKNPIQFRFHVRDFHFRAFQICERKKSLSCNSLAFTIL